MTSKTYEVIGTTYEERHKSLNDIYGDIWDRRKIESREWEMVHVVTSGYFDPIHPGHISTLRESSIEIDCLNLNAMDEQPDVSLTVILNTDASAIAKKGYVFMPYKHRRWILEELPYVDEVVHQIDTDGTVCATIREFHAGGVIDVFTKGGDRTRENIPELAVCQELGIDVVFGVGGGKIASSSELVRNAMAALSGDVQ